MTMFSFRMDDDEAVDVERWVIHLGVGRSEFLREALHQYLVRLESEIDVRKWNDIPPTLDEQALAAVSDWGPAEDWKEWTDAAR